MRRADLLRSALAVALTAAAAACSGGATPTAGSAPTRSIAKVMAPAFSARTLGGTAVVSLASLRGKPVLLDSWATWCAECRTELPAIQSLAAQDGPLGLQVVGVNVDDGGDSGPLTYANAHHLTFPMLHDADRHFQVAFQAVGVPQSELISADGVLVKTWQGAFDPTDPANAALIASVLPARDAKP
jgi:cytochrome c biogenesis protein CcmG/thiol:disulfide interchange protein DsbE